MFTTKNEFEKSNLFIRYKTVAIPNVLNNGYECYFTIPTTDGIAIAVQVTESNLITILRASAEEVPLSRDQKIKIFQFACDFIYGNGASDDETRFAEFVQQFSDKLSQGQVQNTFLLAGFNVGFLKNSEGGMKGIECQTTKADEWAAQLKVD